MQDKRSFGSTLSALFFVIAIVFAVVANPLTARAGTTGILEGTVTDGNTGKPIANATVVATSPSGTYTGATDAHGFYAIQAVLPDTYTLQIGGTGYSESVVKGVFVQQDETTKVDQKLQVELQTIAHVSSREHNNLVQPYNGSDVYNVSGDQLDSAMGGTDTHETVYQYLDTVPGVTPIGGGAYGQPTIRGGFDVDTGYEIDGVPITERQTGYFSTNLTNIGISNVEVITGGLNAANAGNGTGVINSVSKVGTYPGYVTISAGLTDTEFNHYLRVELAGATPNGKYSWYTALDAANSQNYYFAGSNSTTSAVPVAYPPDYFSPGISSGNPGYIYTRDLLGNFHWKPNAKNDIQFLYLNSVFSDQANYGLGSGPGDRAVGNAPCTGSSGNAPTGSFGSGGIAPDGQPCPIGLYNYYLASGTGNFLGHYSALGKVQWSHTINATSSLVLKYSELYNQYIFNQTYSDPNNPADNWYPQQFGTNPNGSAVCPNYPYANGSPLLPTGTYAFAQCSMELGNYYQDREEQDYIGSADYTWTPNENVTVQAGAGQEYDRQNQVAEYLNLFNFEAPKISDLYYCYGNSATYPCTAQLSNSPSHVPYAYGQVTLNFGKFTIEPGLRWSRIFYGVPESVGGPVSAGYFAPSLVGTYRATTKNVFRFSYSNSAQFVGSTFVYQENNVTWDPQLNGAQAYQPSLNHIMDFQWEHEFDPQTSLRFGPYYRDTNNYPAAFTPFIGYIPGTFQPIPTPAVIQDNLRIRDFGVELGINHNDPRPTGLAWWLSASFNNYWTQLSDFAGAHVSFINYPLAQNFLNQGIYVRGTYSPPLTVSYVADLHSHGWHLEPNVYWTFDNFYNTGGCLPLNAAGTGVVAPGQNVVPVYCQAQQLADKSYIVPVLAPEQKGAGYWFANASLYKDLGNAWRVGVQVQNIFNMQHGTTPCYNYAGQGCYPYGPVGISGPGNSYQYQNLTQTPRLIEIFLSTKIGSTH